MKLKEQLGEVAQSYHYNNRVLGCEGSYGCCYADGFKEGFEKAREMAKKLHESKSVHDCFTDSDEFLTLGEEEV